MPTLAELEVAARTAREHYDAERDRLSAAEATAQDAIAAHAVVHARVVGGAGTRDDVTAAATARDEAIATLDAVRAELL